jgi:tRNA pseudouridine55 synthase
MRPERGGIHGLLVFAKPVGPSSNQALQGLRRLLGGVKAGHAGTLDPAAGGVLLVLLGEGAKLVPFLAGLEKEYRGVARFGAETDTQDAAGEVTARAPWEHLDAGRIGREMASFLGESLQEPPMYSAVQVGGRRLYDLARAGREVERASRRVVLTAFDLLSWRPPDAEFLVRASSGTYVRTLCRDLGLRCGSLAHLAALTRTAVGPFRLEEAATFEEIEALPPGAPPPRLVRLADAVGHLPAIRLDAAGARGVREGRPPEIGPAPGAGPGATVRLLDEAGRLRAIARLADEGRPFELLRGFNEP